MPNKDKEKEKHKDDDDADATPPCDPRNYARYYDSPDGCDVPTKVMVAARYGIVTGLIAGTYDILMYSHVVGLGPMITRYARHVVPLGLMGATFALVANSVQHYRNADDPLNYFLGGAACAPLVAIYTRSYHGLVPGGLFLGLVGLVKKEAVDADVRLIPKVPNHFNNVVDWKHDWTLVADPRDEMIHTCDEDFDEEEDDKKKKKKKKAADKKICK